MNNTLKSDLLAVLCIFYELYSFQLWLFDLFLHLKYLYSQFPIDFLKKHAFLNGK